MLIKELQINTSIVAHPSVHWLGLGFTNTKRFSLRDSTGLRLGLAEYELTPVTTTVYSYDYY